ncbi:Protein UPSTREAM OF FLC [Hibiscus syriacus]|uniref:Protein UPSTREAM OF FLC n=1 Tax=Hibiscus syriacus TaxID=106335 RepID=A0A6A2X834_HIBSY|nr:Protein UPSTREAM OF FLC [Hibiscus syriacus]
MVVVSVTISSCKYSKTKKNQRVKNIEEGGGGRNLDLRSRRSRETKPKVLKLIRKVQVVYYLTRNGQLQHPQYMEVAHLLNQPLCLRDVMKRLTVLRGKGVPSLYSWSCKRYIVNLLSTSSVRFEDGEPVGTESVSSRSSVLLQIIARGNLAVNKTKKVAIMKQPAVQNNLVVKKGENLHRGVLCKCAVKKKVVEDHDEMINCMYENPRLGKLQAKE